MRIEILQEAQNDLVDTGLGAYFLDCLFSNIDSLIRYAGIHPLIFRYHRSMTKRFPFAIYYGADSQVIRVHAVLDCRRAPGWTRKRLREGP